MNRTRTPSFICELPLTLDSSEARTLRVRFEVGRQAYNALLGEALRRLDLMRESRAYQAARRIRDEKERSRAFSAVRATYEFQEYALHRWATIHIARQWLGEHLDASTIQKLATRAYRAANEHAVGKQGRPRFKGKRQFDSLEGKSNQAGIRFRDEQVLWQGLAFRCQIDHADPVIAHGLASRIKFVRLVRRKMNGHIYYWTQLICEGQPYRKPQHTLGQGVIGIDPGPRVFGIAGADWGVQVDLATSLKQTHQQIRALQRQIDRQRRANNPQNYLPDGCVRPGKKKWHISTKQRANEERLAEWQRKEAALRKSLQGQLVNSLLSLGDTFFIEKNSYRAFQKRFGRAVGNAGPGQFVERLGRKAESAVAQFYLVPTSLRLSRTCLCGLIEPKPLSQRVHACACGITVQRDIFSAWLARFAVASPGPKGLVWRLDALGAQRAWSGMETVLPMASKPIPVATFAQEVAPQVASKPPSGGLSLEQAGAERLIGNGCEAAGKAPDVVPLSRSTQGESRGKPACLPPPTRGS